MKTLTAVSLLILSATTLFAQTNKKLAVEIAAIGKADQQYRVAAIAEAKKHGTGSEQDKALMAKQSAADVANLAKVARIITDYGYPGKTLVGQNLSDVAFNVIQHNDLEAQEKYLPVIIEAADKGELSPSLIPLMVDRVRITQNQPQVYGTQLHESKKGIFQLYPIGDEAFVNDRRKKAGLSSLQSYLKKWGIDYKPVSSTANLNPPNLYYKVTEEELPAIEPVGGNKAIYSQLAYPEQAKAANINGFVTVQLTVTGSGSTKDITVVKGLGYGCDEEAVRVLKEAKFTNKAGEDSEIRMRLPFPYQQQ
ncbi:energy transducer TonB [Mucilaginibacter achroorhodeus]|nr:energy transducer TonB [Mucilaginibacter achroorhodeus]